MLAVSFTMPEVLKTPVDTKAFRREAASTLNATLPAMQHSLIREIKATYGYTGRTIDNIHKVRATQAYLSAGLIISYTPLGLHRFPIRKQAEFMALVLRENGWRAIRGRQGFGAWQMKNNPTLFMRKQRATWLGKKRRAPYKPLFAPAVAQMANNPKVWGEVLRQFSREKLQFRGGLF